MLVLMVNLIAVGGDGNDTYTISSPGTLTILDYSHSPLDVLVTTGIGLYREKNTYFFTIDGGRHLWIGDELGQQVYALDYQNPENRIEQIRASDATLTYDELIYSLSISPNYLGDTTWDNLSSASSNPTSSQFSNAIDFYKSAYATLSFNNYFVGVPIDSDGSYNALSEDASIGDVVGITAYAEDLDVADSVSYILSNDAGGLFAIDSQSGVVTLAGQLDYETQTSHMISVLASSTDGSESSSDFMIDVVDEIEKNFQRLICLMGLALYFFMHGQVLVSLSYLQV